jgi:capsular polysaccharide export protein
VADSVSKTTLLNENFKDKNILLLQGPLGPFFKQLSVWLEKSGATVYKINFNGGDLFFYPDGICYRDAMEEIPEFIEGFCKEHDIDTIMLFGDCRPVHQGIHALTLEHGLELRVFEEGYLRPNYVTCEHYGVNGYSSIPQSSQFYLDLPTVAQPEPPPLKRTYWWMVRSAMLYYVAAGLLKPIFPKYRHHRPLTVFETFPWIRSVVRKYYYSFLERKKQEWLATVMRNQYYLVPLQVHNDPQFTIHSKYALMENFISEVMQSFAAHAPQSTLLVIKHHPMDRAYTDYRKIIHEHAMNLGITDRILYIHDQHLPTLLAAARGVVVINSTTGLSAIDQGIPVKTCGNAFYDFNGLTFGGSIDDFWVASEKIKPDLDLYLKFRSYLRSTNQIHGSFYLSQSIFASA